MKHPLYGGPIPRPLTSRLFAACIVALAFIFLHGTTVAQQVDPSRFSRVSTSATSGQDTNGNSRSQVINADGRFIAFVSEAGNLVTNDTNGTERDVFLRDVQAGTTTLVSVNQAHTGSGNGPSDSVAITADGRYVLFLSLASDLVAGDTNNT